MLEAKLTRPRVRSEHVPRRDLLVILRSGSRRLTLLAAPAGFGKTTLLAEWAAAEGGPAAAWLSVDEDENDPARFWPSPAHASSVCSSSVFPRLA